MGVSSEISKNVRDRIARHKDRRIGIAKKKVLLLLLGGCALGLSGSPRTSWKVFGAMAKEWKELSKQATERAVNSLYASELVDAQENTDGTYTLILKERGKKKALTYDLHRMKIEVPQIWDKQWKMICFDIPEAKKAARDAVREKFLKLGFYELQDSVFIYPFDCFKEVEYIAEIYDVRKHIRFVTASYIDNEKQLMRFFNLGL